MVDKMNKHVEIELKQGIKVQIEYTPALLDKIREAYKLDESVEVTDDTIVGYLRQEIRSAVDRAEKHA